MKIGIIGAGNVGGTLGTGWARSGHEVVFGVRDVSDPKIAELLTAAGPNAKAAGVAEAAAGADVVAFATPWGATQEAVEAAGDLSGKVVLDCTNPLKPDLSGLNLPDGKSGAALVAEWARGAHVVKIFNNTGASNMANPRYGSEKTSMFYCGDDVDAKTLAAGLAATLGFDPVDAGGLVQAASLEYLALLWINLAYGQGQGRDIAFKLMHR